MKMIAEHKIVNRPIKGKDAVEAAVASECIRAFCIDQEHQFGPYLVERYEGTQENNLDDVVDLATAEIVEEMKEMENSLFSDVVLYHRDRVVAIVQYACGDSVIIKPQLQPHF